MRLESMLVTRPLAGRYAFTKRIRGTQRTIIWLARDQRSGSQVVASVLPGPRAAALRPALEVRHVHAASIVRVDEPDPAEVPTDEPLDPEARIVVAEYVEGRSLQQRIDAGPVATETAVEWIASVADALALLHARGAVHGAVSPRALVVVRPEPSVVPLLTHLIVPPSGAFCSPERVTGGGPSEIDDTWALAATLYSALSRRAPFHGSSRTELARAIVASDPRILPELDPPLWDIVQRALDADLDQRLSTAADLRDALRDWMDQTGVRSLADFAPVAAIIGPSEPPPNVGDLSLVAALARPESPEATAPFRVDAAEAEDTFAVADDAAEDDPHYLTTEKVGPDSVAPLGDPAATTAPLALPPAPIRKVAPVASAATSTSPLVKNVGGAPGAPRATPRGSRRGLTVALSLGLLAVGSAGVGMVAGKLRNAAPRDPESEIGAVPRLAAASRAAPSPRGAATAAFAPADTASTAAPAADATNAALAPAFPSANNGAAEAVPAEAPAVPSAATGPGPAAPPADVTSCARSTLPPGALGTSASINLGYLCTTHDLWGIARKLNQTIARQGQGPGLVLWAHLGRYDLAAISMVITRCCPAATVFTAAVPHGVCESLPDAVVAVGRDPSSPAVDRYGEGVDCLIGRGVRYPSEWWDRIGPRDARGYFEEYARSVRKP